MRKRWLMLLPHGLALIRKGWIFRKRLLQIVHKDMPDGIDETHTIKGNGWIEDL